MRTLTLALFGGLAALVLIACPPKGTPQPVPPSDTGAGYVPPAPIDAGPEAPAAPDAAPAVAGEAGASCTLDDDCASGVCEGPGCGEGEGVCAPATRGCTKDLRTYCGCDGVEFRASGSCPGSRYTTTGSCEP